MLPLAAKSTAALCTPDALRLAVLRPLLGAVSLIPSARAMSLHQLREHGTPIPMLQSVFARNSGKMRKRANEVTGVPDFALRENIATSLREILREEDIITKRETEKAIEKNLVKVHHLQMRDEIKRAGGR